MTEAPTRSSPTVAARPAHVWLSIAAVALGSGAAAAAALLLGARFAEVLFAGAVALTLGAFALRSPVFATLLLFVTQCLALPLVVLANFPADPIKLVFALLIFSTALWMHRTPGRLRGIGPIEYAMVFYFVWNVFSMFAPHMYDAGPQLAKWSLTGDAFSVRTLIFTGVVVPFALYAVGRYVFDRTAAVRAALWTILVLAAYSAVMSILPFTGPTQLVWPHYIIDNASEWSGRAVGVFVQPLVNGMVLALGFAIALLLASRRDEPAWRRLVAIVVAGACGIGLYYTHTRAAWLCGALVLVIGAALAKKWRKGFIAGLCLVATVIVTNWSVFISTDREAGGVGSVDQIQHRLNINATALWAFTQKPLTGWGIGRFASVNTYHHQQWSPDTPWIMGWGDVSHQNELGILAELGLLGLVPWICVLALIAYRLWKAYRTLPEDDLCGRPLAVIAIMALAILFCACWSGELRYFDFAVGVIFFLAGTAIGWTDRLNRPQATACRDNVLPDSRYPREPAPNPCNVCRPRYARRRRPAA